VTPKSGTVENIVAVDAERIRLFVPLSAVGQRAGAFGGQEFRYDSTADVDALPQRQDPARPFAE
jgi:hypothetical protein